MGRGAQQQTLQLTDQQLANTNALNQKFLNQQQQTGNALNAQYQSILANPGLSSADQAAVTGQSQGALASAFDSLQQSAQNRVAATNNSAGFADLTDELARRRELPKATKRRRINSISLTPPSTAKWPRCKGSPASTASTAICSAAPLA